MQFTKSCCDINIDVVLCNETYVRQNNKITRKIKSTFNKYYRAVRVITSSPNVQTKIKSLKRGLIYEIMGNTNIYYDSIIKDYLCRYLFIIIKIKNDDDEVYRIFISIMCHKIALQKYKTYSIAHIDM